MRACRRPALTPRSSSATGHQEMKHSPTSSGRRRTLAPSHRDLLLLERYVPANLPRRLHRLRTESSAAAQSTARSLWRGARGRVSRPPPSSAVRGRAEKCATDQRGSREEPPGRRLATEFSRGAGTGAFFLELRRASAAKPRRADRGGDRANLWAEGPKQIARGERAYDSACGRTKRLIVSLARQNTEHSASATRRWHGHDEHYHAAIVRSPDPAASPNCSANTRAALHGRLRASGRTGGNQANLQN